MADEFFVLKLVERETIACLRAVVILLHIGNDTWAHHQLDIGGGEGLLIVLVFRFKVEFHDGAFRYDVGTQAIVDDGNQGSGDEVGAQQALETDSGSQHGNDFAVASQLRGEEDHGDENEQR